MELQDIESFLDLFNAEQIKERANDALLEAPSGERSGIHSRERDFYWLIRANDMSSRKTKDWNTEDEVDKQVKQIHQYFRKGKQNLKYKTL